MSSKQYLKMPLGSKKLLEASANYWTTPEGIQRRLAMFSESFTYKIVNNALLLYGKVNIVYGFEWEGNIDERTCAYCDSQIGRQYQLGQFLPVLPAHVNCRCGWRIIERR